MYDVDYKKWTDYLEKIIKDNGIKPEIILDLGCGTGSLCIEFSKRGYEMIGVDYSIEMLSCAKDKALKENQNILLLNQDMTNFELYGTVDVVLSMMDSINYITNKRDLKRMFKLVNNYLNSEGLFIFDINTEYKLKNILGNNIFYDIGEDYTYIWQNYYDNKTKICEFELTFFVEENGVYHKFEENHYERAYKKLEVKKLCEECGFEVLNIFDNLGFKGVKKSSERIFFIVKKSLLK